MYHLHADTCLDDVTAQHYRNYEKKETVSLVHSFDSVQKTLCCVEMSSSYDSQQSYCFMLVLR